MISFYYTSFYKIIYFSCIFNFVLQDPISYLRLSFNLTYTAETEASLFIAQA
jgi:hypothetical protein